MLATVNILDMINKLGEQAVREDLSWFSSPLNADIDLFLKKNAIDFAKKKMSVTYIINDSRDGEILGYFTLAMKPLIIDTSSVSKTLARIIERYAIIDTNNNSYTVVSFLLAQFGKNYNVDRGKRITISEMMNEVEKIVSEIQRMVGGGLIYLDVEEENDILIKLYESKTRYSRFRKRTSRFKGKSYIMMIKSI